MTGVDERAARHALHAAIDAGRVPTNDPTGHDAIDALLACADAAGITVPGHRIAAAVRVRPASADHAARALGLAVRPVVLDPDRAWWREVVDPLVVRAGDGPWQAVVAVRRRAELVAADGRARTLDAHAAASLDPVAWSLVPALPDHPRPLRHTLALVLRPGTGRDLLALGAAGLAATALATLTPILSGQIVSALVPTGEVTRIWVVTAVLVLAAVASALTLAATSVIAQRATGRAGSFLTAAAYERLLRLRSGFHREHLPGALAERIAGIESFRAALAGALPTVLAAVATFTGSVLVLWRVDAGLAAAVLGLCALAALVGVALLPRMVRDAQAYTATSIELSGLTFSMLGGISKVKAAAAETRMLDRWTFRFARQQKLSRDLNLRTTALGIAASTPALVVPMVLVLAETTGAATIDLGAFTTATSASAQAAGAVATLVPALVALAVLTPVVRALRPLLEAEPEARGSAANQPGRLRGEIVVEHVTFGYSTDAPVLDDVSFRVPAGSVVAIVGPSGSGKSTILRLLLGLETPDRGAVLFDGRSIASLDRTALLAQMGVVPQDAALVSGSILDNILASAPHLGEDAAWRAAERAQIADDIRALPMGLHTVVGDGTGGFSGGQRQRLMLARALVHDPRILVLDEATSALDNRTQQRVADAIAASGATRVVVAHRLSTIRRADHVIVLEAGRVVEAGGVDELLAAGGRFAHLAARQLT